MKREPVTSSNLASIGYDEDTSTLEVEFLHGGVYLYEGVPAEIHRELMAASSIGSYFAVNIRNRYAHTKVE